MLTPAQIKAYRFQSAGRGLYKSDEVDEIYAKVVASYEQMFKENSELIKRVGMLAERVEEYRRDEELIQKTLIIAQRKADEIERDAQNSSMAKVAKAEARAKELREEAEVHANEKIEVAQARASRILADAGERTDRLIASTQKKADEIIRDATGEAQETLQRLKAEIAQSNSVLESLTKEHNELKTSLTAAYERQLSNVRELPELHDISLEDLYRTSIQSYEERLAAMAREYDIKEEEEEKLPERELFTTTVIGKTPEQESPAASAPSSFPVMTRQENYSFDSVPAASHDRATLEKSYESVDDLDFSKYSEDLDDDDEDSASFFAPAQEQAKIEQSAPIKQQAVPVEAPERAAFDADTYEEKAPVAQRPAEPKKPSGGFKIYMENVISDSEEDDDEDDAADALFSATSRFKIMNEDEAVDEHRRKGFFGKK